MEKDFRAKVAEKCDYKMDITYSYARKKEIEQKVRTCINTIDKLVSKEIEKGSNVNQAIAKLRDSNSLEMLFPQLKDEKVKRTVFNLIRAKMNNRLKENKDFDDAR